MSEDTRYVFVGRRHPDTNVFLRLEQRLFDTGTYSTYSTSEHRSTTDCTNTVHKHVTIVAAVGMSFISSSHMVTELRLSKLSVLEALRDDQLHPCHYSWIEHLFTDVPPFANGYYIMTLRMS